MPANARQYREDLYRLRAHPSELPSGFVDQRDSFTTVYLSCIPFLVLEYYTESAYEVLPSGLVFPIGFLLFWAFYYTYYKPGLLENTLQAPRKFQAGAVPQLILGVLIWFVKVTVVELTDLILLRWLFPVQPLGAQRPPTGARGDRRRGPRPPPSGFARGAYHGGGERTRSYDTRQQQTKYPPHRPPSGLPSDVLSALGILGLGECRDWTEIHRRYRELAKQYHPDLNREVTDVGRRFMMYDAAYRKLVAVKNRYFFEKRA